ncbi:MAG: hypothetical protein LBE21_10700, partial [Pseudomonadales bacterium]|nr:hypothetical protein [Pseudomonadales bacterium]
MNERRTGTVRGARLPSPKRERRLALLGRFLLAALALSLVTLAGVGVKQAVEKVNAQKITEVVIDGKLNFVSGATIQQSVLHFVA